MFSNTATSSLFSKPATTTFSTFTSPTPSFTSGSLFSTPNTLSQQPAAHAQIDVQPYGSIPPFPQAKAETPVTPSTASQSKRLAKTPHYKLTPRSAARVTPRKPGLATNLPIFDGTAFHEGAAPSPDAFTSRQSIKKLVIDTEEEADVIAKLPPSADVATLLRSVTHRSLVSPAEPEDLKNAIGKSQPKMQNGSAPDPPMLTKPEYYTIPPIKVLQGMSDEQLARVSGFTVGRRGVGEAKFSGETDVRGLNLDAIIQFNDREIVVYPDESGKPGLSPPSVNISHDIRSRKRPE